MKRLFSTSLALLLIASMLPAFALAAKQHLSFTVIGIKDEAKVNVEKRLAIIKAHHNKHLSTLDIQTIFKQAQKDIPQALMPYGYYKPVVNANLTHKGHHWLAAFNIQPGAALRITHLIVKIKGPGKKDPAFQDLEKHFPLKQGQRLQTKTYETAKQHLFDIANHRGYMKAKLSQHKITIDKKKYTATVTLDFQTGPRYHFGKITIETGPYAEHFIKRYFPFKSGDFYSTEKIQALQRNLTNSIYFNGVSVRANPKDAKRLNIPVQVHLTPSKAQDYTVGAGYGTDTGPRVTFRWQWRRASKTGNHVQISARVAPVQSYFLASYIIPGSNPTTDQFSFNVGAQNTQIDVGNSFMYNLGVAFHHERDVWQQTFSLMYQREHYQVEDQPSEDSELLIPSAQWNLIKADNIINPKQGLHLNFTMRGAPNYAFSDTAFVQGLMGLTWMHTFWDRTRLISRGSFGLTAVNNFDHLPLSLRFLTGGARTVRGYAYQAIGPGQYLKMFSQEIQQRLFSQFFIAGFFDAGNASSQLNDALKQSVGIGVGYYTMIGPIEITAARAIKEPGKPYRIQFSMGPDL